MSPGTLPQDIQRVSSDVMGFELSRPNLLVNGGFELWSNGPGPFDQPNQVAADGWTVLVNRFGETGSVQQVASTAPAGSQLAAQITGTTQNVNLIGQTIAPNVTALNGLTVALSFQVLAPTGGQVNAAIGVLGQQAYQMPQLVDGTGDWQTVRLIAALPSGSAQPITVALGGIGLYTFVFDNVSLVIGSSPADYQPLPQIIAVDVELRRYVQRLMSVLDPNGPPPPPA